MQIKNIKKLFSFNLLSLFGYMSCVFWFYEIFISLPHTIAEEKVSGIEPISYFGHINLLIFLLKIWLLFILILILMAIAEYFISKKFNFDAKIKLNIPNVVCNFYTILFWLGIFLVFSPICFILIKFI